MVISLVCQNDFDILKQALTGDSVLKYPDFQQQKYIGM